MSENTGKKASVHQQEVVGDSQTPDAQNEHRDTARGRNETNEVDLDHPPVRTSHGDTTITRKGGSSGS